MIPKRKGLSLERLSTFLAVADAGSFAAAAPGNPVLQSQMSRQVRELEDAVGGLVERSRRGITLTPAGHHLARVVRELAQGLDDLERVKSGTLRVRFGAGDSVIQWLVIPRLPRLSRALESIELELTALGSEDVEAELLAGNLDFGILRMKEATSGELTSAPLGQSTFEVFRARGKGALPLAVATGEPAVLAAQESLGDVALRFDTFPRVAQAVRTGLYRGVLPAYARSVLPASEFKTERSATLDEQSSRLSLVWRKRTLTLRPGLARLRDALKTTLKL